MIARSVCASRARTRSAWLLALLLVALSTVEGCASRRPLASSSPPVIGPGPAPASEPAPTQPFPAPGTAQPPTRTPPSAPVTYVEEGIASWYGVPFHGRRAANGEIFDMNALVAAHRTLPFCSIFRVTNLNNVRQV